MADSFLLADGGVVALDGHRSRFLLDAARAEVRALAGGTPLPSRADVEAFWAAAVATLPDTGSWFPRIELVATEREALLRLRVRPAPRSPARSLSRRGPEPTRAGCLA
ncbi:hypothetical protein [Naasia aerilata]|uniref:Uncharacterized protein n=1 Tax=Naasia aerilata TaxID=1162966 RepID=A0ABN6XSG0_9MICO|nr:hypothetical protein [Naasia aerilata]BDZ46610.1 hypothetical protein GCM10025866_25190 [Naasia aerilata]